MESQEIFISTVHLNYASQEQVLALIMVDMAMAEKSESPQKYILIIAYLYIAP